MSEPIEISGACAGWIVRDDGVEPVWRVEGRLYDSEGREVLPEPTVYGSQLTAMRAMGADQ